MLTETQIKRFIDDDIYSEAKKKAGIGQKYYEGEHDIKQYRMFYYNADGNLVEDTVRSNIKISHPFFTELTDQLSSNVLSFTENPIRAKDNADGLQDYLDEYFDDDFWAECEELIAGAYVKGFDYIYGYVNKDGRTAFQEADAMGVVEVREKDTDDGCKYVIYHYMDRMAKVNKVIRKIQVWTEKETYYYVQDGTDGKIVLDESEEINPRPHVVYQKNDGKQYGYSLGFIPFWRLDNNKKKFSGIKPIKDLIDDYDLMECGISNNLQDFDTPIHVVKGYEGTDLNELQQNLKTKKIVGVDSEGGVEVKTVNVPYEARKAKADEDEKNIYRFGMGFNSSQVGDGNVTNVVIKSRYALLDLKADKMEKRLKRLLKQLVKVVLDEINSKNASGYTVKDVYFDFKRMTMTNESENVANDKTKADIQQEKVNTILNMAAQIGDDQTLKALCEVMEWDYEELKIQAEQYREEQKTAESKQILENTVTVDE